MNLIDALHLILRRWKTILAAAVLVSVAVAGACRCFLPDVYCAKATLYVLNKYIDSSSLDSPAEELSTYYDLRSAQLMASDFAEVANSQDMRDSAARIVGLNSIDDFDVHAEVIPGTRIINLLVIGPDAQMAERIARALAESVSNTAIRFMGVKAVNYIGRVAVSAHPIAPQRKLYTAAAFTIGFALASIYVVGEALVNTRVHSASDLADIVPVPVFGHIAVVGRG
ncbi:MAG: hypothetical protein IJ203_08920 [Atopobiaceae bacterium]|nr:hypothetical protein [Atopobiaceae bacterium]